MKIVEKPTGGSLLLRQTAMQEANAGQWAGVAQVGRALSAGRRHGGHRHHPVSVQRP